MNIGELRGWPGLPVLLADTQNNPKKELEYLSIFSKKQVDGVIFIATVFTAAHKAALKNMMLPVVLAGHGDSDLARVTSPSLTTIHYDYEERGELAAKMMMDLLEKGESTVRELVRRSNRSFSNDADNAKLQDRLTERSAENRKRKEAK